MKGNVTRQKRRKKKSIKKRMIAYSLRGIVFIVLLGMLSLMVCGCIFIYEHLHIKENADTVQTSNYFTSDEQNIEVSAQHTMDLLDYVVVLDAGHGGTDGGAVVGNIYEKDINLCMVEKLSNLFEQYGATVICTRAEDTTVSLAERVKIANVQGGDLFISLHCNSFEEDMSIYGFQCFYDKNSEISRQYAESISEAIEMKKITNIRIPQEENYYVTRNAVIPAVLIEIGYLSNNNERKKLEDEAYLEQLALGIVTAIVERENVEELFFETLT